MLLSFFFLFFFFLFFQVIVPHYLFSTFSVNFLCYIIRRKDIKLNTVVSVNLVRKSIVSNDHRCTHKCDFSVFGRKYPFLANLVKQKKTKTKKIETVRLSWNSVSRLIQISRIQWWLFTLSVLDQKHPFSANLAKKIKIVNLKWNLAPKLIRIWRIQWWCSLFLCRTGNTFRQIWFKKSKLPV